MIIQFGYWQLYYIRLIRRLKILFFSLLISDSIMSVRHSGNFIMTSKKHQNHKRLLAQFENYGSLFANDPRAKMYTDDDDDEEVDLRAAPSRLSAHGRNSRSHVVVEGIQLGLVVSTSIESRSSSKIENQFDFNS